MRFRFALLYYVPSCGDNVSHTERLLFIFWALGEENDEFKVVQTPFFRSSARYAYERI